MKIAYARVSTTDQNLERQFDALQKYGYDKLIQEKFTGTRKDREGLNHLFDIVREGDTVIVESISRLGRKLLDILTTVEKFAELGITFVSLKENIDTSTPTGKAMFQMLAVIAELERNLIAERTREGLQSAKNRGKKLGRPKLDDKKVNVALRMYDSGEYSVKEITKQTGISQGTLYRHINKKKIKSS